MVDIYDEIMSRDMCPQKQPRRKRGRPEAKVQKQIAAWLISKGCIVIVTDAGLLNRMGLGYSFGIPAGWPDLTGCLPNGRFIGVECKAAKGKQSPIQILQQMKIESRHGLYILAHSLDELILQVRKENLVDQTGISLDQSEVL
jgi:hypothetical protein